MTPSVVVVGAASRDLATDDPRGWRLGGGVSYTALMTARLGLATAALVGVDAEAADAHELDALRTAGVDVRLARLAHGPVFENIERPEGRLQRCLSASDPIDPALAPPAWRDAAGWVLAPVAAELPPAWAEHPSEASLVALGWQGLLRRLVAGQDVVHITPTRHPILDRADVVGLSRDDLDPGYELADLCRLLRPGATLVVTRGDQGGILIEAGPDGPRRLHHYPAIPSHRPVDATGAGDTFLAALAAARIEPRLVGGRIAQGYDALLAAAAASLVLEGVGLAGVPDRGAVRRRMSEARRLPPRDAAPG